ncbi:MAG: polysaccharide biosynthesis/export family protein [Planctomycetia bacterium]|nr:polysaccharide biosynthesis/export family protein [Planctomycetia bacterium]
MTRMRQNPPKVYQLGPGDTLGIYIESVIGKSDEPPPVHFPDEKSGSTEPSLGFPVPIREDGTIALPLVEPIKLTGLTLTQATLAIRRAYTVDQKILPIGKDRIIVTLQRRRKHKVLVVREEANSFAGGGGGMVGGGGSGGGLGVGLTKRGTGAVVALDAYENDLLHALNATGGLPGLDAQNEILIFRGTGMDAALRDRLLADLNAGRDPCTDIQELPDDENIVRIPIRFYPDEVPEFKEEDIILQTGDIVYIQSRDRELYYLGGALRGGAQQLPRDYDLDILQAIALAGGQVSSAGVGLANGGGGGGRGGGGGGGTGQAFGIPPSRAIILRKIPGKRQIAIKVDLCRALENPAERILIQPEDTIIVQYTLIEELGNMALGLIQFNFLFSGFSGNGVGR